MERSDAEWVRLGYIFLNEALMRSIEHSTTDVSAKARMVEQFIREAYS